jgi:hypothetical protein
MNAKLRTTCVVLLATFAVLSARGQAKTESGYELYLKTEDIPKVLRILPGLVEASQKGRNEVRSFLAKQELSFGQFTQVLSNISVAYSAIVFDEWIKEMQPQQTAEKAGEYTKLIEQARRQLDEITSRHQRALKDGRTALAANKEIVNANREAVDEIITLLRDVVVENLPPTATTDLRATQK